MRVFILEDDPIRINHFGRMLENFGAEEIAFSDNVETAKTFLLTKFYDVLFLDHDLESRTYVPSEEPNTGYQLAKWLREKGFSFRQIIIHSMNAVGSERIYAEVKNLAPEVMILPFPLLIKGLGEVSKGFKERG